MSKRNAAVLLDDVRTAIDKIVRYTAGMDRAQFLADDKTIDAVIRNLEIIGEAVNYRPISRLLIPASLGCRSLAYEIGSSMSTPGSIPRSSGKCCKTSLPELRAQLQTLG